MFGVPFGEGIIKRGINKGLLEINTYDIREYAKDRHRTVDDAPFGGGPGMLMKPGPIFDGVEDIINKQKLPDSTPIVLMSPQGELFNQKMAEEATKYTDIVLICGRYEGVDERVRNHLATREISIGDYVLGGGEIPAMVVIEAVSRLTVGVVGSIESTEDDTFTTGLIQHPQYTRPSVYRDWSVPDVLLSGNHLEVEKWRRRESLKKTIQRRPDLLEITPLTDDDLKLINQPGSELG
jgi:tRNA (guanine37-N1)-methyltransferase